MRPSRFSLLKTRGLGPSEQRFSRGHGREIFLGAHESHRSMTFPDVVLFSRGPNWIAVRGLSPPGRVGIQQEFSSRSGGWWERMLQHTETSFSDHPSANVRNILIRSFRFLGTPCGIVYRSTSGKIIMLCRAGGKSREGERHWRPEGRAKPE